MLITVLTWPEQLHLHNCQIGISNLKFICKEALTNFYQPPPDEAGEFTGALCDSLDAASGDGGEDSVMVEGRLAWVLLFQLPALLGTTSINCDRPFPISVFHFPSLDFGVGWIRWL